MVNVESLRAARAALYLWDKHGLGYDEAESEPIYTRLKAAVERAESAFNSSLEKVMEPAKFSLDFLDGQTFEGYTRGEDRNGFACPYFTFEQAQRLVVAWKATGREARYDRDTDRFTFEVNVDEGRGYDSFQPVDLQGLKVYPLGTRSWIWEEVE
jgi:hypothetical protein